MPTPANSLTPSPAVRQDERLSLTVGGVTHHDWLRVAVHASFLTPAGAWEFSVGNSTNALPTEVHAGARAVLRAGNDVLMTGLIDDVEHGVSRGQHLLTLTGRDNAAALVDCSAPIFTAQDMTLHEVMQKIVRPLGITQTAIHAEKSLAPKKFTVDPGESAWDALKKAAEVSGLWPWVAPDGTLIIGGPDYSAPPVASLVMKSDGSGNVLDLMRRTSIAGRYSSVTVLTQGHALVHQDGKHNRKGTATDDGFALYRPLIRVMGDTDSDDEADTRARKLLSDSRLNALTLTAVVRGVRTSTGVAWTPGQRVALRSDIHDIDGIYFLMARSIRGGRGMPLTTTLTLKESGVWIPDAWPKSRHKPKGKKTTGTWTDWRDIK
ncbi:phage baseplate assembly protein [Serratia liquefaciens]|uniref:phage baseplate assembly protein n=1 Tax=Serratia liquefaciens TaxID=614 RepID=UPI003906B487